MSSSPVMSSRYCISSASSTFPILFLAKKKKKKEPKQQQQRAAAGSSRFFECRTRPSPPLILKNNAIARVGVGVGIITTDISSAANKNVNTFQDLSDHNSLFYPPRPKTKSPQPGEEEEEEEEIVKVCDGNGSKKKKKTTLTLVFDSRAIAAAFLVLLLQISIVPILPSVVLLYPPSASAVLYSPDTKVPRTGELALRKAIPANANMKAIQDSLEDISYLLRIPQRKPYGTMEADVKKALKIAKEEKESILSGIPEELKGKGTLLYNSLTDEKGGLQNLIEYIKEKDADKVSVSLASTLDTVAELELLQAPGLSFLLPGQYLKYPRLTGRGTVEFVIEKGDGSTFFPTAGGEAKNLATIQVVIDGYSAPLTAGNFAKLVIDGAYDGVIVKCSDQAVLADSELNQSGYSVPLEVMPSGQFEPLYKSTLSVQDGELPVLPLSVYGAVAMAHSRDSEEYSSPSQFFFYLYDKRNAGLGGLSFDEGQFSVFGYTTVGRDILSQIKSGDVVRSAKLVQGGDRLIVPYEE